MNKKMRELLNTIKSKTASARALQEAGEVEKAGNLLNEVDLLQQEFAVEKRLFENEKDSVDENPIDENVEATKKASGFEVLIKALRKKPLTEVEKALLVNGENGENLLIPEDVRTAINLIRADYPSARTVVGHLPTRALTGSMNYEVEDDGELIEFEDGSDVPISDDPKFRNVKFDVKFFGKLIPVSNILQGAEQAGLMSYLRTWFVRRAVRTENKKIFAKLKDGKEVKSMTSWKALKSSINFLSDAAKVGALIVTNATGWDYLDNAEDENGKPILQDNPANRTQKMFQNLPITVYDNQTLPNVGSKAPIFFGATKNGVTYIEYESLQFAVSEHALFGKNQTALRVIEGFDVMDADKGCYEYGLLDVTTYTATFTVKKDDVAVEGATVAIGESTATTNATGVATLSLPNGKYTYKVSGTGISDKKGTITVIDTNTSVSVSVKA